MSVIYRRTIPIIITVFIVLVLCARTFTTEPTVGYWGGIFLTWSSLAGTTASLVGTIVLLKYHLPRIKNRSDKPVKYQWFYSSLIVGTMATFIVVGQIYGMNSSQYQWLYQTWQAPITGLLNAVSAFFALSAIYRSFRIRTLESALLVIPALIIMLYDSPLGATILSVFPGMIPLAQYIFMYIGPAAFRGFILACSCGTLILSIRTIFGKEKGYLAAEERPREAGGG